MAVVPEREEAQELVHLGLQDAARYVAQASHQLQILPAGEMRVKMRLLRDVADAPLERGEIVIDAVAPIEDLALGSSIRPVSILTVVLLPAPFGPRYPRISPG